MGFFTSACIHNHFNPQRRPHDPANPCKHIDRVFRDDTPIIEGLPIEVGHGCLPVANQLVNRVLAIQNTDGDITARALLKRLMAGGHFNSRNAINLLVGSGLMSEDTALKMSIGIS